MASELGSVNGLIALPRGEAHLWYVRDDDVPDAVIDAWMALLTPEEEARRARFIFEHSRREFLTTRALARTTLSRYAPVDPRSWTFSANKWGRPAIETPEGTGLSFNLTNTRGLVACLVARDREIGVDVEDMERHGDTVKIADRFFSPTEVRALHAVPEERQRRRFFDYWTLKEAYIKARGMGLAIPLDQFSFLLAPHAAKASEPIRIAFDPRLGDRAETWQFAQLDPTARHRISMAIRREAEPDLPIVVRRAVPLLPGAEILERVLGG